MQRKKQLDQAATKVPLLLSNVVRQSSPPAGVPSSLPSIRWRLVHAKIDGLQSPPRFQWNELFLHNFLHHLSTKIKCIVSTSCLVSVLLLLILSCASFKIYLCFYCPHIYFYNYTYGTARNTH